MGVLLFIGFGYFVTLYGKPLQLAGVYVGILSIFALISGEELLSLIFVGAITYAYTAFVYMVVDHFSDGVFAPIFALGVGAMIFFGAGIFI